MITEPYPDILVGDIEDVYHTDLTGHDIDVVVSVCQDSVADNVSCDYHHFELSDGEPDGYNPGEFRYGLFEDAVEIVRSAYGHDQRVLVHCHMGRSRSVSVVAALIACLEDERIHEAYGRVRDGRDIQPSQGIRSFAERYVEEHR